MPHIPKALLFQKRGYWWINYSLSGERQRISTGTKDRGLAEIRRKDFEPKFFKGEIGARPEAPPKSSLAAFFRKYIEFISSDSQIDRHPDLARLNSLQG